MWDEGCRTHTLCRSWGRAATAAAIAKMKMAWESCIVELKMGYGRQNGKWNKIEIGGGLKDLDVVDVESGRRGEGLYILGIHVREYTSRQFHYDERRPRMDLVVANIDRYTVQNSGEHPIRLYNTYTRHSNPQPPTTKPNRVPHPDTVTVRLIFSHTSCLRVFPGISASALLLLCPGLVSNTSPMTGCA